MEFKSNVGYTGYAIKKLERIEAQLLTIIDCKAIPIPGPQN